MNPLFLVGYCWFTAFFLWSKISWMSCSNPFFLMGNPCNSANIIKHRLFTASQVLDIYIYIYIYTYIYIYIYIFIFFWNWHFPHLKSCWVITVHFSFHTKSNFLFAHFYFRKKIGLLLPTCSSFQDRNSNSAPVSKFCRLVYMFLLVKQKNHFSTLLVIYTHAKPLFMQEPSIFREANKILISQARFRFMGKLAGT